VKRYVNRRSLQPGAWIALILIMLLGGYYRLYLVGWQLYTLMFSLVVLVLVTLLGRSEGATKCAVAHGHVEGGGEDKPTIVETALHFVPLFLFAVVGPTTLGSGAGSISNPMTVASDSARDVEITAEKTEDGYLEVTLLDLYTIRGFQKETLPVRVVGMLYFLTESDKESLPFGVKPEDVGTMMFRYSIWCCVADARQVTVVLGGGDFSGLETGQWLEVKGKAHAPKGSMPLFTIEVEKARPIDQPENPYIY
jgi:hypothetical protein